MATKAMDDDIMARRSRGLDRAFEILDFFRTRRKPMRPNEIAAHIGAPRSSVYELVNLLLKHGRSSTPARKARCSSGASCTFWAAPMPSAST